MIWAVRIILGLVVLAILGAIAVRVAMELADDDPSTAGPVDFDGLSDRPTARSVLVVPPARQAELGADIAAPVFSVSEEVVRQALVEVLQARPRTRVTVAQGGQVLAVERSFLFRFPDEIAAEPVALDGGTSLFLYSRSRFGRSDLGVNRARVEAILAAVAARIDGR